MKRAAHLLDIIRMESKSRDGRSWLKQSRGLALLVTSYIVICCLSLRMAYPAYEKYYILYDESLLHFALVSILAFGVIATLFLVAKFSFGYLVSFYFYTTVLGYLWLNNFSKFQYNHLEAGISAGISAIALLLPALFITSPIKRTYEIPERLFWHFLTLIILLCGATAAIAASYNFRIVAVNDIYNFRDQAQFPAALNYAIGAATSVLLPFAFACLAVCEKYRLAAVVLLIAVSFYPSTLSKTALFTPAWLFALALLSRFFQPKVATILSLLLPILAGIILISSIGEIARRYFDIVNLRMIIVPSSALDVYNEYFSKHPPTYFCQIWLIKPFVPCTLQHQLGVEMQNNYALGNFNASLFATEGIASVGVRFAPIVIFLCGLGIALGNCLSAGLPPRVVLLSSGVIVLLLQNVALSTVTLTHSMWILFALWYVTPRSLFGTDKTSWRPQRY